MSYRKDVNDFTNDGSWTFFSVFFKLVLPVVLFLSIFGFIWHACATPAALMEKTMEPDNVIYNYEYFKRAFQDILALDAKIVIAKHDLDDFEKSFSSHKEMDREDKIEDSRLRTVLSGLRSQLETQKAEYNARVMMVNRKIFKTNDLPDHIN